MPAASRGFDGGKLINGRKRHIVTDCLGLLRVAVTAANIGDREAATGLLTQLRELHRDICLVWADGGYTIPHRLGPRETRPGRGSRQTDRRYEGVRGASEAVGGRADPGLVDALAALVPGLRDATRDQRGDDPVVDDHADGSPPGEATSLRPALNAPDASWSNQPRSARRFAFDRTPSIFAAAASIPSTATVLAVTGGKVGRWRGHGWGPC
ncbi:transposase [Streptomyces sp. DSM 41013]